LFTVLNVAVLIGATAILVAFGGEWWPVIAHVILLAMAMAAVFAAWAREGREFISLGVLARLPLYVLWKLPMYLGLARRGTPKEWLRTER
jgi:hypothetical protein